MRIAWATSYRYSRRNRTWYAQLMHASHFQWKLPRLRSTALLVTTCCFVRLNSHSRSFRTDSFSFIPLVPTKNTSYVAIILATAIKSAHSRLIPSLPRSSPFIYQRAEDLISYIIASMEKHKLWLLNYKQRKDSTMSLLYNLVTQQDAANNIQIAHSMKQDSMSKCDSCFDYGFLAGYFRGYGSWCGSFWGCCYWGQGLVGLGWDYCALDNARDGLLVAVSESKAAYAQRQLGLERRIEIILQRIEGNRVICWGLVSFRAGFRFGGIRRAWTRILE